MLAVVLLGTYIPDQDLLAIAVIAAVALLIYWAMTRG